MSGRTGLVAVKRGTVPLTLESSMSTGRSACLRITGEPDSCGSEWTSCDPL